MSRPIKFRIYDKQEECYSDKPFSIDQLGICYIQDEDEYWEEIDENRFIVEQYTGLKDKNGKEIYGGDIISFENEKGLARVLWLDGKAMFGLKWLDCGVEDELDYWIVCRGPVEVIGNIHENPELLGGEE